MSNQEEERASSESRNHCHVTFHDYTLKNSTVVTVVNTIRFQESVSCCRGTGSGPTPAAVTTGVELSSKVIRATRMSLEAPAVLGGCGGDGY